jgi:hypothetical protein
MNLYKYLAIKMVQELQTNPNEYKLGKFFAQYNIQSWSKGRKMKQIHVLFRAKPQTSLFTDCHFETEIFTF